MNYLVISYRSNYTDYCRGCAMGSSSSDHETAGFDTVAECVKWAAALDARHEGDRDYASWSHELVGPSSDAVLLDAAQRGYNGSTDGPLVCVDLDRMPEWETHATALKAEREKKAASERRRQAAAAEHAREATERRERAQLASLREKYEA